MNKVKGYRNMVNATQKDFAELLGITQQAYCRKENGFSEFRDREKRLIKDFLVSRGVKVTIEDLFF